MQSRHGWALGVLAIVGTAVAMHAQGQLELTSAFVASEKPGPLELQAKAISPDNPIPRRIGFVVPIYPAEAAAVETRLVVTLRLTLDASGYVAEARRITAPILAARQVNPLVDRDSMSSVLAAVARASIEAARQWRYEAPVDAPIAFDVTISFTPDGEPRVTAHGAPALPSFISEPGASVPTDIPVKKIKNVAPIYPVAAKEAGIQGVVVLEAAVAKDGHVLDARVLKSIPELDQAAVDAVKQWAFEPVPGNDDAMPLTVTVTVQFTLQ